MFKRLFAKDPVKMIDQQLQQISPQPELWPQIAAYLTRGRRPRQAQSWALIQNYLELRDSLGALAAFRVGGKLSHDTLAQPCREFFEGRGEAESSCHWACFLLAADHLLDLAHEASLAGMSSRTAEMQKLSDAYQRVHEEYLAPMKDQGRVDQARQATEAAQSDAAAMAA